MIDERKTYSGAANSAEICKIIEYYYKKIGFPKEYDTDFLKALKETGIPVETSIDNYDYDSPDGKKNLLSYLYMCKALEEKYVEKGISNEILYDTLKDILIWTNIWTDIKGELYLGELSWLSNHLKMKLFKLGRLQFCMGQCKYDIPEKKLSKGDNVIEVHIPRGGGLTPAVCEKSIQQGENFFKDYFPEFRYKAFICDSWLLDDTLKEFLPEGSNILRFSEMFDKFEQEKSDDILKYIFKWNTTRRNLEYEIANSSLAEKIKKAAMEGKEFYVSYGILRHMD